MLKLTEENLEQIQDWIDRSTQFAKTDKNFDLLVKYIRSEVRSGHEVTVEMLNAFITKNSSEFEWLATQEMLAQSRAALVSERESSKPKLKGLTMAERLCQLGVPVSAAVRAGMSHSDRSDNDNKQSGVLSEMAKAAAKTRADIERQEQIAEARSICIYRPGPGGRLDHGVTASARKAALARFGITE